MVSLTLLQSLILIFPVSINSLLFLVLLMSSITNSVLFYYTCSINQVYLRTWDYCLDMEDSLGMIDKIPNIRSLCVTLCISCTLVLFFPGSFPRPLSPSSKSYSWHVSLQRIPRNWTFSRDQSSNCLFNILSLNGIISLTRPNSIFLVQMFLWPETLQQLSLYLFIYWENTYCILLCNKYTIDTVYIIQTLHMTKLLNLHFHSTVVKELLLSQCWRC